MRGMMKLFYSLIFYSMLHPATFSLQCPSNATELNFQGEWNTALRSCKHPENIKSLRMDDNGLTAVDGAIFKNLTSLSELRLNGNRLKSLNRSLFAHIGKLNKLYLRRNRIADIKPGTFRDLPSLKTLDLTGNRLGRITKTTFAHLPTLNNLYLEGNSIKYIAVGAFDNLTSLTVLKLQNNELTEIPRYTITSSITALYASENPIQSLTRSIMVKYGELIYLHVDKTKIQEIPDGVFDGNPKLEELSISDGPLKTIGPGAFHGPSALTKLNLSATDIEWLPDRGIEHLTHFYIKNVENLWKIPVVSFKNLQKAEVTYHYHCCLIDAAYYDGSIGRGPSEMSNSFPTLRPCTNTTSSTTATPTIKPSTGRWPPNSNLSPLTNKTNNAKLPNDTCFHPNDQTVTLPSATPVTCTPRSDAFNPCDDLLGPHVLRVSSWLVMIFAILGNVVKLLVLLFNKRPLTIGKMLTLNLAFANLCMGLYLALLVSVDLYSYGVYQNYARAWQFNGGCRGAGFLSIFSTEMAAYTLTVITVERYFMIVYPLDKERHLTLRQITRLMLLGWVFSLVMATLPLCGVSSYEKVAICLPFEVEGVASRAYVTFLLVTNGLTFLVVLMCYARMYLSLGPSSPSASGIELRVAQRMALLVVTNFSCWFPIALLSLIAIYGHPLIDVSTSKFLLVFIYPINSFTNPYLYAIGTKAFQLDILTLLSKCSVCSDMLEKRTNRLRCKLDIVPTNSTRVTSSNNGSGLSLNSDRSRSSRSGAAKTCSCVLLCIHKKQTYELRRMSPTASPVQGSRDGSPSNGRIASSTEANQWSGRRSSAKHIFMDGQNFHCDNSCVHNGKEYDRMSHGKCHSQCSNRKDDATSSLLCTQNHLACEEEVVETQVDYNVIPVVYVTPC